MRALLFLLRFISSGPLLMSCMARAVTVDPQAWVQGSSTAIMEGRPAIAYSDSRTTVKYVRAVDAAGSIWDKPVQVAIGSVGGTVSLLAIAGNPAVFYSDNSYQWIKVVRATDAAGTTWSDPVEVVRTSYFETRFSVQLVDGNPAFCFPYGDPPALKFIRALDAGGTAWPASPLSLDAGNDIAEPCMQVVQGHPAIIYRAGYYLWYIRATDAAGTAWGPPVNLAAPPFPQHFPSLQMVNGRPAVSYCGDAGIGVTSGRVYYQRAADATGSAWNAPVKLDFANVADVNSSLAVVNGRPAIGYRKIGNGEGDLKYVQALDSDGDTLAAWGPPVSVDSVGDTGERPNLLVVDGRPALFHHDNGHRSLEYIRATGNGPGTLWPADVSVRRDQPGAAAIPDGQGITFGKIPAGQRQAVRLLLQNPNSGSLPLTGVTMTMDGPDAAEFSITPALTGATLLPATNFAFTVEYVPFQPGAKAATLHIASSAEGSLNPYDITLTGETQPDIAVWPPPNTVGFDLDTRTVVLPLPVPGVPSECTLLINNLGVGELRLSSVTFEGPDAAEFTLTVPPAPVVALNDNTSLTFRHVSATAIPKTATLRITSNSPDESPYTLTVRRVPGTPDNSFHAPVLNPYDLVAVQADGKIMAFSQFAGLARFHPGGDFDLGFFAPSLSGQVRCLTMQKDGASLIGGDFALVDGQPRAGLARLFANGALDPSFDPHLSPGVTCIAIQPDGKILAGGSFLTIGGADHPYLARFDAEGSLDPGFNPLPDRPVACLALQPDGKILIGGHFEQISGTPALRMARLLPGGTFDVAFDGVNEAVRSLVVQPDGKILAGTDSYYSPFTFLPDGTLDPAMPTDRPALDRITQLALQVDGKCLCVGGFSRRLDVGGRLDEDYFPDTGGVRTLRLAQQEDGKVLIAGTFTSVNHSLHTGLARLGNNPASSLLKREGSSTIRWLRSGSAPEVWDVTFDLKPDLSPAWTPLGSATRIPGGWELSGLALPSSGTLRAQARAGDSIMEAVLPFGLTAWRQQYFQTPDNSGDAADDADPDHDGLTNFTEYAFGLSPVDRASNALPEFQYASGSFTATFTAPEGRENVVYSAEWSATMEAGTWVTIPDTGTAPVHSFSVTAGQRTFVRYRVGVR